jgi:hypothetical protein
VRNDKQNSEQLRLQSKEARFREPLIDASAGFS